MDIQKKKTQSWRNKNRANALTNETRENFFYQIFSSIQIRTIEAASCKVEKLFISIIVFTCLIIKNQILYCPLIDLRQNVEIYSRKMQVLNKQKLQLIINKFCYGIIFDQIIKHSFVIFKHFCLFPWQFFRIFFNGS